jgi:putative transposase
MSHTHASIRVHVIFSTKDRKHLIPVEIQPRLWGYMGATANNLGVAVLAIGGISNHAHLGLAVPPSMKVAEVVQKLKANSSRWMTTEHVKHFSWQTGYGAFSVSIAHADALVKYIQNQPEHHKRESFEDEYERILKKHGIFEE